nr:MAG: replication polyprotein [Chemarfal virus 195]
MQWHKLLGDGVWLQKQQARVNHKAIDYCCKRETRCPEAEARLLGFDPDQIGPHLKGVMASVPSVVSELEGRELYPWQADMMAMYNGPTPEREIVWISETTGNTGKSALARHLAIMGETLVVTGKGTDVLAAVASWFDPKKKGSVKPLKLILWDLPRCTEGHMSYSAMEGVKNGCFFSGKYESNMVVMNKPHVWVFSNQRPDTTKLSKDRWNIFTINDDKVLISTPPTWPVFNPATVVAGREEVQFARELLSGGAARRSDSDQGED